MKSSISLILTCALIAASCGGEEPTVLSLSPPSSARLSTTTSTVPPVFECSGSIEDVAPIPSPDWSTAGDRSVEIQLEKAGGLTSVTPSSLMVLDSDAEGEKFRWVTEATAIDLDSMNMPAADRAEFETFLKDMNGTTIDYLLPAGEEAIQVLNRSQITEDSTALVGFVAAQSGDSSVLQQTIQLFGSMDDEQFALTFAEIQFNYHSLEGLEIVPGERFDFDARLPNPFGKAALPATATVVRSSGLDSDGCLSVRTVVSLDSTEALPALIDGIVEITEGLSANDRRVQSLAKLVSITSDTVTQIDPATGLVYSQVSVSRVKIAGDTETETTTVTDRTPT